MIMHYIVNPNQADPEGRLAALDDWDESIAREIAKSEGIVLTDRHLNLAIKLREFYRDANDWTNSRAILKFLEVVVQDDGSRKRLYHLFPNGPVRQAFGSVH